MKKMYSIWTILIGLLIFTLSPQGIILAQEQTGQPQFADEAKAVLTPVISYQGRLEFSGYPVEGLVTMTFRFFNAETGGTQFWSETKDVTFNNGLFQTALGDTNPFTEPDIGAMAQTVWLEIAVGATTLPRQRLMGSPYAFSLVPGADISGSMTASALSVTNTGSGHGLYASGTTAGMGGASVNGVGVDGYSETNHGVLAHGFGNGLPGAALQAKSESSEGIAVWALSESKDTTLVSSNDGDGPLFKGFGGNGGEHEIIILNDGTVQQDRTADGLVKAAALVNCTATTSAVINSFNNVGGSVTVVNTGLAGACIIDFGFQVDDRFVSVNAWADASYAACDFQANVNQLYCIRRDHNGSATNGQIMIIIY